MKTIQEILEMTLDEIISELDTACGMLIVPSIENRVISEAREKIMSVSLDRKSTRLNSSHT